MFPKTIEIDNLHYPNESHDSVFAFISKDKTLLGKVRELWDLPKNICTRIFHTPLTDPHVDYFIWGRPLDHPDKRSKLLDSTAIQNLVHFGLGKAPRVYKVFILKYAGRKYVAQVLDFVEGEGNPNAESRKDVFREVSNYLKKHSIQPPFIDINQESNIRNGMLLDFQGASFDYSYTNKLEHKYEEQCVWATNTYQPVDELNIGAFRDGEMRVDDMKLWELEPQNNHPRVLDIGCSGGFFCRWFEDNGARRVVGADYPSVIEGAREMANYLGFYMTDWIGVDFAKVGKSLIDEKFDIVLYLSMYRHIGFPDWVKDTVKPDGMMIFEQNGDEDNGFFRDLLNQHFHNVKLVGKGTDFDNRMIYHCRVPKL